MRKYILSVGFIFTMWTQSAFSNSSSLEGKWCKGYWAWSYSGLKEDYIRQTFEIKDQKILFTKTCMVFGEYQPESTLTASVKYDKNKLWVLGNRKYVQSKTCPGYTPQDMMYYEIKGNNVNFSIDGDPYLGPSDSYKRMKNEDDCLYKFNPNEP